MKENKTGDARLRAGLPRTWIVGDKTGSGANGTTNDIAIAWPVARSPILVTVYLTQASPDSAARDAVIAKVGGALADAFGA